MNQRVWITTWNDCPTGSRASTPDACIMLHTHAKDVAELLGEHLNKSRRRIEGWAAHISAGRVS